MWDYSNCIGFMVNKQHWNWFNMKKKIQEIPAFKVFSILLLQSLTEHHGARKNIVFFTFLQYFTFNVRLKTLQLISEELDQRVLLYLVIKNNFDLDC